MIWLILQKRRGFDEKLRKINNEVTLNKARHVKANEYWILKYFDSFGIEYILKEIKEFGENKIIIANVFRIHENDSRMCG